jgi:hypothetical protein
MSIETPGSTLRVALVAVDGRFSRNARGKLQYVQ